jgi:RimJ/RimL family protein N-acetyltransferase
MQCSETQHMDEIRRHYLSRLPDLPLWVETRDLLLREGSRLLENPSRSGFVVWSTERGSGSVVGEPESHALALAAADVPELLAFADNIERVRSLLPEFEAEPATVFSAPEQLPPAPPHRCRAIRLSEIAALEHLPDILAAELSDVAKDGVTVVASFDDVLPVAFAYVASETESLWDVSIDTIPSHRRQGYAAAAVLHLMRRMREYGKSAVWGALENNRASANLARRLGFVENDRLWVLTRSPT